jgi:kynurenine formamidase
MAVRMGAVWKRTARILTGFESLYSRPVHSKLLGAGIPIGEHLANLDAGFRSSAVPPKVKGMGRSR